MSEEAERASVPPDVAAYKRLLREYIDRRPSGTRKRLAAALGTHKSFVSQITNPAYKVAIPAHHVQTIVRVCHLSAEERDAFVDAYARAHPGYNGAGGSSITRLLILIPEFRSSARQAEVIDTIEELARRIISLAQEAERD